jgi:drug/metabolite transporter (DMT)-like permease
VSVRSPIAARLYAAAALVGFAANSLLCRAALGARSIDATSFTVVRIASGALVLALFARGRARDATARGALTAADLRGPLALYLYAICFSLAYLRLPTGMGALVLFGSVQATMIGAGLVAGERPTRADWLGLALAIAGLVTLLRRGLGAPDPVGATLMIVAGAAWGGYSLLGRGVASPLIATARNFTRALPLALVTLAVVAFAATRAPSLSLHVSARGAALAVASGALASGVGYALWYAALPSLSAIQAAVVQLAAPLLAATAGVLFLAEQPTLRLAVGGALIAAGVTLAIARRAR